MRVRPLGRRGRPLRTTVRPLRMTKTAFEYDSRFGEEDITTPQCKKTTLKHDGMTPHSHHLTTLKGGNLVILEHDGITLEHKSTTTHKHDLTMLKTDVKILMHGF